MPLVPYVSTVDAELVRGSAEVLASIQLDAELAPKHSALGAGDSSPDPELLMVKTPVQALGFDGAALARGHSVIYRVATFRKEEVRVHADAVALLSPVCHDDSLAFQGRGTGPPAGSRLAAMHSARQRFRALRLHQGGGEGTNHLRSTIQPSGHLPCHGRTRAACADGPSRSSGFMDAIRDLEGCGVQDVR